MQFSILSLLILLLPVPISAQPVCYMVDADGRQVNLDSMCGSQAQLQNTLSARLEDLSTIYANEFCAQMAAGGRTVNDAKEKAGDQIAINSQAEGDVQFVLTNWEEIYNISAQKIAQQCPQYGFR